MEKRYLYIVLTRPNTIISKLIQIFKKDEYTHASISLNKGLDEMYSLRENIYNPFIGIFKLENINKGLYKVHKVLPGLIMEVEVSKEQYEKVQEILESFIANSHRYKYNYKGLLYSAFNKEACNDYRFMCSEFVYHLLKESQIADFKVARNLVRPQSLLNIRNRVIFKGNLKELESLDTNWNLGIKAKVSCIRGLSQSFRLPSGNSINKSLYLTK